MKLAITTLVAATLSFGAANAAVIYSETFDGQDGKGAFGQDPNGDATPVVDTSGVDWSIEMGDAALFNDADIFGVVDGAFTVQDTNAGCVTSACNGPSNPNGDPLSSVTLPTWLSPVIDVTNFENLSFFLDVTSSGGMETSGGINAEDTFLVQVITNIGNLEFDQLGIRGTGAFDVTAAGGLFNGLGITSVQFSVIANSYAGSETFTFDNVLLTGDAVAPVPLPASGLLLIAGLGGLALRRRNA